MKIIPSSAKHQRKLRTELEETSRRSTEPVKLKAAKEISRQC